MERGEGASALLIDRLADAVGDLLAAGPPPLPDDLRADLLRLAAAGNDATRSPHAGKLVGERAGLDDATGKGARHGEA